MKTITARGMFFGPFSASCHKSRRHLDSDKSKPHSLHTIFKKMPCFICRLFLLLECLLFPLPIRLNPCASIVPGPHVPGPQLRPVMQRDVSERPPRTDRMQRLTTCGDYVLHSENDLRSIGGKTLNKKRSENILNVPPSRTRICIRCLFKVLWRAKIQKKKNRNNNKHKNKNKTMTRTRRRRRRRRRQRKPITRRRKQERKEQQQKYNDDNNI